MALFQSVADEYREYTHKNAAHFLDKKTKLEKPRYLF
jgi:hypothetical protein